MKKNKFYMFDDITKELVANISTMFTILTFLIFNFCAIFGISYLLMKFTKNNSFNTNLFILFIIFFEIIFFILMFANNSFCVRYLTSLYIAFINLISSNKFKEIEVKGIKKVFDSTYIVMTNIKIGYVNSDEIGDNLIKSIKYFETIESFNLTKLEQIDLIKDFKNDNLEKFKHYFEELKLKEIKQIEKDLNEEELNTKMIKELNEY